MHLGPTHGPPRDLKPDGDDEAAVAAARLIEGRRFPEGYRRILLAAVAAFSERGFHGTTTRDIAAQVGMSPAALYVHFGSKEDVLYRIATSALDLTLDVASAAANRTARPSDRLQAVVRALTAWHARHSAVARVVLYQLDALTPDHLAEVTRKQVEVDRIVRQVIADGVSAGEFDVTDTTGTATAVLSLCVDVARWYRPNRRRTPEQTAELNAQAALRIVGAQFLARLFSWSSMPIQRAWRPERRALVTGNKRAVYLCCAGHASYRCLRAKRGVMGSRSG